MSTQQTGTPAAPNRNFTLMVILSIYLIGTFLWRALAPAHEYPMRPEQLMEMGVDLMCIVGLVGVKTQLSKGTLLFVVALLAGIGLFAIRLTSDASWWTGHLVYYLEPR